ncbi:MAG: very short patch repair endonuclease [Gemmatimonadetes bacterium]|nr:very short patch repair endonuclease [Gemmatimonadota bacterium]
MVDIVGRAVRSRMMAGIGGKDTKPEMVLRRALHARGLRYRLHDRKLPGTPDLVFHRFGAVCFVHGCFWHRHQECPYATVPATRPDFWRAKFRGNVARDRRVRKELLASGWRVAIVWECALRAERAKRTSLQLDHWLHGDERFFETSLDWDQQC